LCVPPSVRAAASKSIILGSIILATSGLFVPIHIAHPAWMVAFLVLTAVSFSLFGFILELWADNFEKLQIVPLLIITPFNGPNRARVFSAMPLS
jgi:ABC-2 type transport system permease protein